MTDKALISDLTWRSLEMQREAFDGMPQFVIPDELQWLLRQTTRKDDLRIHVISLGVIAAKESDLRDFLKLAAALKAEIVSKEDAKSFKINGNHATIVKAWKESRRKGINKIGGRISGDSRRAASVAGIEKIRDRWPLSSVDWPTQVLLDEAGVSYNTAKTLLPPRPVAQYNHRAKDKRAIKEIILSPKPVKKMDFCGVYVFQIEDDIFKIGSSRNSQMRLKQVSAYQKKKMKVVALFNMEIEKATALEAEVHYRLRKHRCEEYNGREIFKTTLKRIIKTVKQAKKYLFEVPNEE